MSADEQLELGRVARDEGVDAINSSTSQEWRQLVDEAIAELAARGEPFVASDLIALGVPDPEHPNALGGAFHRASRAGVIECVGYGPSRRPTVHASIVRVWRGKP